MKVLFTLCCLVGLTSTAFSQTAEQTASRSAAGAAKSQCTDAKYDSETAEDSAFLDQVDAGTARTMCMNMYWLQVGDGHFMEGSLQSAEGDAKVMQGATSRNMGLTIKDMADMAWNAGNFAGAKTMYDMATMYFNTGKAAYLDSIPFFHSAEDHYEDAREAYDNG